MKNYIYEPLDYPAGSSLCFIHKNLLNWGWDNFIDFVINENKIFYFLQNIFIIMRIIIIINGADMRPDMMNDKMFCFCWD